MNRQINEDHPSNIQAKNTDSPRIQEGDITQVSEKTECRGTKKTSQEFSRSENPFLGALSVLDEPLLNPQPRACYYNWGDIVDFLTLICFRIVYTKDMVFVFFHFDYLIFLIRKLVNFSQFWKQNSLASDL